MVNLCKLYLWVVCIGLSIYTLSMDGVYWSIYVNFIYGGVYWSIYIYFIYGWCVLVHIYVNFI